MTDTKTELLIFRDNLSLPEGAITLEYPANMSASSYQYFARWVQIVLDKTKNSMILEGPGGAGGGHNLGSFKGQGGFSSSDSLHKMGGPEAYTGIVHSADGGVYRSPVDLGASGVPNSSGASGIKK